MRQRQSVVEVKTRGRGFHEITALVAAAVREAGIATGQVTVFCAHTSCSLCIQENADPSARRDLERWLERLAPEDDAAYTHRAEGPDDMPAHLRALVTRTSETIPVAGGRLALGAWQGIYLAEHRARPHARRILLHVIGE
jgi:secondary thiamine-phosphate synthase enzyme